MARGGLTAEVGIDIAFVDGRAVAWREIDSVLHVERQLLFVVVGERFLPLVLIVEDRFGRGFDFLVELRDLGTDRLLTFGFASLELLARRDINARRGRVAAVERRVVEEGHQLVVLALAERVVFVIVALAAADGQAEQDRAGRIHAIDDRFDAKLLRVGAAFFVDERVAMKAGRDDLVKPRVREHVTGELLDDELIERQVAVEGIDDPIAILPDRARLVAGVAVRVGIARGIEPVAAPTLSKMGRGE